MKVIILAGGWGSRLGHITENIPKPMIMIGEKSIPDIGGNMLLTGWYKGSHSSLINENNG